MYITGRLWFGSPSSFLPRAEIGPDEDGEDAAVAASKRASPPAQPVASARCGGGALPPPTIRPVGKTSQQVSEQCMKRAAGLLEQGGSSTGSEEVPALDSGCSAGKRRKAIKIPEAEPAADKHAPASCAQELLVPILIPKKEWPVAASAGDFGATEATPLPNERAPEVGGAVDGSGFINCCKAFFFVPVG